MMLFQGKNPPQENKRKTIVRIALIGGIVTITHYVNDVSVSVIDVSRRDEFDEFG